MEALREQLEAHKEQLEAAQAKIRDLERRDAYHDGPNVPPSKDTITCKVNRKRRAQNRIRSGKKPGAQKGHTGRTNKPKPDSYETHTAPTCPNCSGSDLKVTSSEIRSITEIPPPPSPHTTRHTINTCQCTGCGRNNIMPDISHLPRRGELGKRIISRVFENFLDRMPNRLNARSITKHCRHVSSGTIHNILSGVGMNLGQPAEAIALLLLNAGILNIDETSIRLKGKLVWVWIFYDPMTGDCLYVLRASRGRDVLHEILGAGWGGTVVCDGWSAYGTFTVQRCWAHIIREMKDLSEKNKDSTEVCRVYDTLCRIYDDACDAKSRKHSKWRLAARQRLEARVSRMIHKYGNDPVVGKFIKKIARAKKDLFRFVLDPNIPSTNNDAERGLREIVVHRKIRGCIRSNKTMEWLGNLFSCVTTWKNRNLDRMAELMHYI